MSQEQNHYLFWGVDKSTSHRPPVGNVRPTSVLTLPTSVPSPRLCPPLHGQQYINIKQHHHIGRGRLNKKVTDVGNVGRGG
jgi:hypothetical protein